jgi:hypothetical protein
MKLPHSVVGGKRRLQALRTVLRAARASACVRIGVAPRPPRASSDPSLNLDTTLVFLRICSHDLLALCVVECFLYCSWAFHLYAPVPRHGRAQNLAACDGCPGHPRRNRAQAAVQGICPSSSCKLSLTGSGGARLCRKTVVSSDPLTTFWA